MSTKKLKIEELEDFDAAEFITEADDVLAYLNIVLEENDPAAFAAALGTVARSAGMSKISEHTGLARESLYKALKPQSQPRFETISKVANSLGFKFVLEPLLEAHDELAHS